MYWRARRDIKGAQAAEFYLMGVDDVLGNNFNEAIQEASSYSYGDLELH